MKSTSNILKTLIEKMKKIMWTLGLHAFSLILFFVFIDFIIGSFIFYNYVFLVEKTGPNATGNVLRFDEKNYQAVLKELQLREPTNEESLIDKSTFNQNNIEGELIIYVFSRILGPGASGDDVLQLQKILSEQGFLSETPNGNYDSATVSAVKNFQKANNIRQTGNVGLLTQAALNQILISNLTTENR
jgi:hypothetical protein